ncbi:hypothetical protein PAXRUDRAFT_832802 [Paxillus rubicundulus Ve08.2h10]|uniref:RING-type E3 ubiquitin transferase n=1 Tax=Paxillus rubicundulus Ve08.2h10 TaxID=930991 RepID=A0A0D0DIU7_9AGAM|nr:hypothetical protein PAXRUDRAFT_832802 [Paxillus rubicundulus Ve08.2h10]
MPVCRLCPGRFFVDDDAVRMHRESKHWCCQTCDKEFATEAGLDQHREDKHSSRFCCDTCDSVFRSQHALDQHETDKHPLFECLYCEREFTTEQGRLAHEEAKHSYRCDKCDSVLRSQQALDQHETDKHPLFECLYCEREFTTDQGRLAHEEVEHTFCCDTCGTVLRSQQALDQHETDKHPLFECLYCERDFTTEQGRTAHEEAQHSFCCDTCGTLLHSQPALDQHKTDNHPRFECLYCEREFTTGQGRAAHEQAKHTFFCDTCGTLLHSQPALDQHKTDNHPLFECLYCEHEFTTDQGRLTHEEVKHTFCCDKCGTVLRSQQALDEHETDIHPLFECLYCEREFTTEQGRTAHEEAKHSFCCDTCGTLLHSQPALDQHKTDNHPLFECLLCERMFITVQSLEQHNEDEHSPRYRCDTCDTVLHSQQALDEHETEKHALSEWRWRARVSSAPGPQGTKHPPRFECQHCDLKFPTDDARRHHEDAKHPPVFECRHCDSDFTSDNARLQHENVKHKEFRQEDEDAKHNVTFQCSCCSLMFHSMHERDAHEESRRPYRTVASSPSATQPQPVPIYSASLSLFPPPIDSKPSHVPDTQDQQNLICRSVIYEQPCTCSICQRPPASPLSSAYDDARSNVSGGSGDQDGPAEDLQGHVRASRETVSQLAHRCSFCYISLDDGSTLLKHLEDRMSFRCHMCQMLSCSNDTLQDHLLEHPTCRRCGKVFIDELALCNHVASEHPVVVCWDCDGAVIEQDSLELHYAVSPDHPSCPFCRVGKRTRDDMDEHIKNHHATELHDSASSEHVVSQSDEQVATDGSSNATGDDESALAAKQLTVDNVLGQGTSLESKPMSIQDSSFSRHKELELHTSPLQTEPSLSLTPLSTPPRSRQEADASFTSGTVRASPSPRPSEHSSTGGIVTSETRSASPRSSARTESFYNLSTPNSPLSPSESIVHVSAEGIPAHVRENRAYLVATSAPSGYLTTTVAGPSTSTTTQRLHCRICLRDPCEDVTATICGHIFCKRCITQAVVAKSECPVCGSATLLYCLFKLDLSV